MTPWHPTGSNSSYSHMLSNILYTFCSFRCTKPTYLQRPQNTCLLLYHFSQIYNICLPVSLLCFSCRASTLDSEQSSHSDCSYTSASPKAAAKVASSSATSKYTYSHMYIPKSYRFQSPIMYAMNISFLVIFNFAFAQRFVGAKCVNLNYSCKDSCRAAPDL